MGDKPISFRDADGNFVSAADVWNEKKLEELFNRLNPNRALRLARTKKEIHLSKEAKKSRASSDTGFCGTTGMYSKLNLE
ncbi:UDP-N-acetylglucosamine 1-carboxyvinyltransferase domain protein [Streptococcus pneumoniae GA44511]|nr:UDP-N-acetylglucosamine 1-carboxyvinyltransferase domain protein [Streptococcus pneumoniae GA44511]